MLSSARMEEFVTEEEEPWYDQQDLEQGKIRHHPPCPCPQHPLRQLLAPAGQLALGTKALCCGGRRHSEFLTLSFTAFTS